MKKKNYEHKPWLHPKKLKVQLVLPNDTTYVCAGDTVGELHADIIKKMQDNNIQAIDFGFGWNEVGPVSQGWAHMHIKDAIKEHLEKGGKLPQ